MVKPDSREETQIEDLEAFEEWEETEGRAQAEVAPGENDADCLDAVEMPETPRTRDQGPGTGGEDLAPGEQLSHEEPAEKRSSAAEELAESLVQIAPDVPVPLVVVMGKKTVTLEELLTLRIGEVIELGRPPSETVDVVVSGRLIARGELVDIDGQLGVRILKMVR
jgi:type III secretion system YscQ/HrcQ family protein